MEALKKQKKPRNHRTYLSRNFEALMAPSKKLYITMEVDNKKNVPIERTPPV